MDSLLQGVYDNLDIKWDEPFLKPCPWCGKDALLEVSAGAYRVRCSNLDCAGHPSYSCVDKHAAQRHWNTRAG